MCTEDMHINIRGSIIDDNDVMGKCILLFVWHNLIPSDIKHLLMVTGPRWHGIFDCSEVCIDSY